MNKSQILKHGQQGKETLKKFMLQCHFKILSVTCWEPFSSV